MTAVDSPEKILFASTTHAFLRKEAPLRYVRELHASRVVIDPAAIPPRRGSRRR